MKPAFAVAFLFLAAVSPVLGDTRTYAVDPEASRVLVQVGKSGVFGFAGHTHEVEAPGVTGEVVADDEDLSRSSVSLTFQAASLRVTGKGEPAKDVPKVQETMLGPKVLDAGRFPTIAFRSQKVSGRPLGGGAFDLQVTGEMTLHGVTRTLVLPLKVETSAGTLTAAGRTTLRHDHFGMVPISAGGGTVKVKNELVVEFRIVGRAP